MVSDHWSKELLESKRTPDEGILFGVDDGSIEILSNNEANYEQIFSLFSVDGIQGWKSYTHEREAYDELSSFPVWSTTQWDHKIRAGQGGKNKSRKPSIINKCILNCIKMIEIKSRFVGPCHNTPDTMGSTTQPLTVVPVIGAWQHRWR